MKSLVSAIALAVSSLVFGQGLELMPKDQYEKLVSPPKLAGAGARMSLPETHVIPANYFPAPGNQGDQPSCTAWASGYALMSFYQANKKKWGLEDQAHVFSPSYLYQNIKAGGSCANCTCGTYISDALNFLKNTGNVPITDFPYDANKCTAPSSSLKSVANQYRITNWFRVEDVRNLTDLKTYLSKDIPVVIASYTDEAFSNYYNKKESDTYKWKSGQDKGGNHAMLLVGYDNTRSAFKIMNSWGKNWGSGGFVWVDYESFRTMISEAYVIEKDYELVPHEEVVTVDPVKPDPEEPADDVVMSEISVDNFGIYGYAEEIREGRNYYTFGFVISEEIEPLVSKIVYEYDHPSFTNKYATSTEAPYFPSSYEGYGCLESMGATVYFNDGSQLEFAFDGCEVIELSAQLEEGEEEYDYMTYEITPVVYAEPTAEDGIYDFSIQLRGIENVKEYIEKVVYDRNDESFAQRYQEVYDRESDFEGGYSGWGCLPSLGVTIYYTDQTTETFEIDMCEALGW
ncbi:MAG: pYEATS domain-containing protein [Bacteroidota bacterium]